MTEKILYKAKAAEMGFLRRVYDTSKQSAQLWHS